MAGLKRRQPNRPWCCSSSSYRSAVIDPLRGRQQHGVAAQGILASSSRRPPFRCAAEEE
ncbi:unnamed protein product, partial [Musa acuminata var. zebrina]